MRAVVSVNITEAHDVETDEEVTELTNQVYKDAIEAMFGQEFDVSTDSGLEVSIEITGVTIIVE